MLKNVTITVDQEVARWARKRAAEENISLSRFIGRLLEERMRASDEYWKAYRRVRSLRIPGLASQRLTRDQIYARRR
ncbi:MAG: hypothetical protein RMK57_00340 [Bryobacterales bacterium]|nr:hypothetical protein [Bryobacteraceae bacterium]MDW8352954.1 hypothetical protein [Bryobacterales bacterium]